MLVLSRKLHEEIAIGDDIVITVVKISGRKIRIGIAAPKEMTIRRSELPPCKEKGDKPSVNENQVAAPLGSANHEHV